jgi:hypothetical protein
MIHFGQIIMIDRNARTDGHTPTQMQNVGGPSAAEGGSNDKKGEGPGFFDEAGALIDFKGASSGEGLVEPTSLFQPNLSKGPDHQPSPHPPFPHIHTPTTQWTMPTPCRSSPSASPTLRRACGRRRSGMWSCTDSWRAPRASSAWPASTTGATRAFTVR